mmetsp:Transcript_42009/g.131568  ORF Transcript_42009/g.131568 Transcript_42009/m.131568 type:complete len:272 (-) Transcript_42009:155-970(-)
MQRRHQARPGQVGPHAALQHLHEHVVALVLYGEVHGIAALLIPRVRVRSALEKQAHQRQRPVGAREQERRRATVLRRPRQGVRIRAGVEQPPREPQPARYSSRVDVGLPRSEPHERRAPAVVERVDGCAGLEQRVYDVERHHVAGEAQSLAQLAGVHALVQQVPNKGRDAGHALPLQHLPLAALAGDGLAAEVAQVRERALERVHERHAARHLRVIPNLLLEVIVTVALRLIRNRVVPVRPHVGGGGNAGPGAVASEERDKKRRKRKSEPR